MKLVTGIDQRVI